MLKRYNDFLFESLINESLVVYGYKFKKLLKGIDSPVAKALIDMESKDLAVANNYIDIDKDDKEKISFIPDRRAQQLVSPENREKYAIYNGGSGFLKHSEANADMFKSLEYEPVGDRCYHPSVGEKGEILKSHTSETSGNTYVKIQYPGGITIVNKNNIRFEDVSNLPFSQNRQTIRIGRGIRGLLSAAKLTFTDAEIEQFVNKYKSEVDKENDVFRDFELVKGSDIAKWYNYETYEHELERGPLSNSCMADVPSRYFNIYMENPEVCSLLILKTPSGDKINGRALVWKLSQPDIIFVDRIYTHNDSDIELFRQYAKKQGWYTKVYNGSSNSDLDVYTPTGAREDLGTFEVKVKAKDYGSYPYLDTLQYLDRDKGLLTTEDDYSNAVCLTDTGGGYEGSSCDSCGGDGRVDCYECDSDGRVNCEDCDGDGEVDCEDCDGKGEIECGNCDGEGEIDGEKCDECEGKGKIECRTCDGDGEEECGNCNGRGNVECGNCDGNGRVDCPECN